MVRLLMLLTVLLYVIMIKCFVIYLLVSYSYFIGIFRKKRKQLVKKFQKSKEIYLFNVHSTYLHRLLDWTKF